MAGKKKGTSLPTDDNLAQPRKSRGRLRVGASFPTPPLHADMPSDYMTTLGEIKERIRSERLRVALSANSAMILMYWEIGRIILARQNKEGWGTRVIDRLSVDLGEEFPEMRGLSPRNLKYMRKFAESWPDRLIVQRTVAQLPWRTNLALIEKLAEPDDRLWYARQTAENGWSREILVLQIESGLHERQGKATHNFALTLPPPDSDMAAQVFKDPYLFDFIGTADPRREREVEQALVDHVQKFLLELGAGFAFIGRQVHLEFSSADYYLDLLFYHLKLRCYVVVELKAVPFEPEFVGKLNMYMGAVDDLLRHPDDKPTIGLLLCKGKNRIIAEYALSGFTRPIGVADWKKQLTETLPADLKGSLPTVEEIEAELSEVVEKTAKRSRQSKSGGTVRESPAPYGPEHVRIMDEPFDAADGAYTPFGRRWDGGTITLNSEHLAALKKGKIIALDVRDEYVAFLKADGPN
jgi:predicted nuclease of restriction endonuclease-like (RecB) superfamily